MNFAATNAFQAAEAFARAVAEDRQLKTIEVIRSPVCRLYSDCWDVKLKFFDPDHGRRAGCVCRLTVDVSDLLPVTLGRGPHLDDAGSPAVQKFCALVSGISKYVLPQPQPQEPP